MKKVKVKKAIGGRVCKAKGGGIEMKGKTRGKIFNKGGHVKSFK